MTIEASQCPRVPALRRPARRPKRRVRASPAQAATAIAAAAVAAVQVRAMTAALAIPTGPVAQMTTAVVRVITMAADAIESPAQTEAATRTGALAAAHHRQFVAAAMAMAAAIAAIVRPRKMLNPHRSGLAAAQMARRALPVPEIAIATETVIETAIETATVTEIVTGIETAIVTVTPADTDITIRTATAIAPMIVTGFHRMSIRRSIVRLLT